MKNGNDDPPNNVEGRGEKFRRAIDIVEKGYDDRWPARGLANARGPSREYQPLDDVSRADRTTEYLKRPSAKR